MVLQRERPGAVLFSILLFTMYLLIDVTQHIYIYTQYPRIKICCISNQYTIILSIQHTSLYTLIYPLGSMYGIYAKIGDILMGSMLPYIAYMDIHGSYGYIYIYTHYIHVSFIRIMHGEVHKKSTELTEPTRPFQLTAFTGSVWPDRGFTSLGGRRDVGGKCQLVLLGGL